MNSGNAIGWARDQPSGNGKKGNLVTSTKNQVRRLIAAGAFAVAAVAAPFAASALTTNAGSEAVALPPGCTAWFGNIEDGKCLAYSNGTPIGASTPSFGIGTNGIYSGPLVPGATISQPIG